MKYFLGELELQLSKGTTWSVDIAVINKVILAQAGKSWEIVSWDKEIWLMDNLEVNIQKLIC